MSHFLTIDRFVEQIFLEEKCIHGLGSSCLGITAWRWDGGGDSVRMMMAMMMM